MIFRDLRFHLARELGRLSEFTRQSPKTGLAIFDPRAQLEHLLADLLGRGLLEREFAFDLGEPSPQLPLLDRQGFEPAVGRRRHAFELGQTALSRIAIRLGEREMLLYPRQRRSLLPQRSFSLGGLPARC